jgi:hypothetical protein
MGIHTWFLKSKELHLKYNALCDKLDAAERCDIYLEHDDFIKLEQESEALRQANKTDYHDVFRTNKRNSDGTYTDDVISSREECFEWIEKPENHVHFKHTMFDTDEQEQENKKKAIRQLNQFWDEYPDGIIYFG